MEAVARIAAKVIVVLRIGITPVRFRRETRIALSTDKDEIRGWFIPTLNSGWQKTAKTDWQYLAVGGNPPNDIVAKPRS
ncbi:hypothetical protein GCM10011498_34560 [Amylibacter cionae]|uniref:Uncharacterized protein n=1 Tax=Neptunicoccus cionae TaxID=2035344 RepID=A0A916VTA4_9RHOB|nr:hypothetical protein GCM10011498_34560 [Amylibacter cionae]